MLIDVDHDMAPVFVEGLGERAHGVVTPRSLGREAAQDEDHLFWVAQDQRLLITHNDQDDRMLHRAWIKWSSRWLPDRPSHHFGILILTHSVVLSTDDAIQAVEALLRAHDDLRNTRWIWRRRDGWVEITSEGTDPQ